ncbi:MAG: hypothetical protein ACOX4B_02775 [Bacillota bacterium]|jgi:DcuC family C4-dicarboxylate transporter|nr:hypothetical protein [Candidatus Fermentithermobacillaceae bacterium]
MDVDGQLEARPASEKAEPADPHTQMDSQRTNNVSRDRLPAVSERRLLAVARVASFSALLVFQTLSEYLPVPALQTAAGLAAFIAWIFALSGADRTSLWLSLALVTCGVGIFAAVGTDPLAALVSFGENSGILMIMVLVPLVGIVIDRGGYADALGEIAEDIRRPAYLFVVALILAYMIGSVLLNAAIALVWTVLAPIVVRMGKSPDDVLVPSLPRGYNATLLWTPSSPAMAVALALTGAAWTSVVKAGFLVSLCALAVAVLIEVGGPALRADKGRQEPATHDEGPPDSTVRSNSCGRSMAWRKTIILALGLGSFIAGVVILQELGQTIYQAIIPCVVLTLTFWGKLTGKPREIWKAAGEYFPKRLPRLSSQFLLMTTAGFIGTALQTALKDGLPGISVAVQPSTLTLTLVGSLLVWAISVPGIHSLIGMTIVYSVIGPFANGMSPAHMSMTLLLGATLGFTVSPVSATILVTSGVAGKNSVDVGLRRQWKYVLVSWIVCSVALTLLKI